jgi:NAD(P)H-hydrate epimerase
MKILSAEQIRALDKYTIENEPIASIDLMERAATAFVEAVVELVHTNEPILIFSGMGNNGGDGLAVARLLIERGYLHVSVYVVKHAPKGTADFERNRQRLENMSGIMPIETERQIPSIPKGAVVIDALFGTGLSRPVQGITAAVIQCINRADATVYSVDIPSGMFCDTVNNPNDAVVESDITFTFHAPKLSFLLPSSGRYVAQLEVLDIGLNKAYAESLPSPYTYVTHRHIASVFRPRHRFSHKGTYGHALICAGSCGKMGAAVLAVQGALRSGAGLVTAYVPEGGYNIIQATCPEAMALTFCHARHLGPFSAEWSVYSAIGIGPGLGTSDSAAQLVQQVLNTAKQPVVFDADALNIIAASSFPLNGQAILTPHPGEFRRLAGDWGNDMERLEKLLSFSRNHGVVVVLKGAHTSIALPDGRIFFNSTGNPGMAKGGSGDVLTGVITALLAQGYSVENAAVMGVYLHGKAGDLAAAYLSQTGMTATDIVRYLPETFSGLE